MEFKGAAANDVVVHNIGTRVGLAVQTGVLDVDVLVADIVGTDGKGLAVADVHRHFREQRSAEDVFATSRLHLVDAHRREDVPGRHLTNVLIAAQTVGGVVVEFAQRAADELSTLPGLAHIVIEVEHVVAGFVAVGILSDKA